MLLSCSYMLHAPEQGLLCQPLLQTWFPLCCNRQVVHMSCKSECVIGLSCWLCRVFLTFSHPWSSCIYPTTTKVSSKHNQLASCFCFLTARQHQPDRVRVAEYRKGSVYRLRHHHLCCHMFLIQYLNCNC